jgi:preprotein translocase subunit YajC
MFVSLFLTLLAEAPEKPPEQPFWYSLLPLVLIFVVFYFLFLRPKRLQDQQRQAMISNLDKNDKVLTVAGIYGTVIGVSETEDEVTIKVDENTRLRMTKSSIGRNLTKEEALRAQQQKKT